MSTFLRKLWNQRALLFLIIVPIVLLPVALVNPQPKWQCAYVVLLMACYWLAQVIPIAVTSLLPLILFPMFGIMTSRNTAMIYMSDASLVFFGGMVLAVAIEESDLHKKMALRILLLVGINPRWLMAGLMISTWFLSMWITNIASTAMIIPIAQAILVQLLEQEPPDTGEAEGNDPENLQLAGFRKDRTDNRTHLRMRKGLILSLAYAANTGGMATLTGTPSNLVLKGQIDMLYAQCSGHSPVTYGLWSACSLPLSFLLLLLAWLWLQIFFFPSVCRQGVCKRPTESKDNVKAAIRAQYESLGHVTFSQVSVLAVFCLLVVLWVTRDLGGAGGWGQIFPTSFVSDATTATAVSVLLFILPAKNPFKQGDSGSSESDVSQITLLSWKQLNIKMPWGVLLLLGGGFSVAKGCEVSGLSDWVGGRLESLSHLNPTLLLFIVCYVVTAATELTSNVAITTLFLPVLSQLALVTGVNPLYYMYPATLAANLSFVLPVATPCNAVVFSSGYIKVVDMVLSGLVLNILCVPLVVLATETWGEALFGLDVFPDCFRNVTLSQNSSITG